MIASSAALARSEVTHVLEWFRAPLARLTLVVGSLG